jgi:hypothetical protein
VLVVVPTLSGTAKLLTHLADGVSDPKKEAIQTEIRERQGTLFEQ